MLPAACLLALASAALGEVHEKNGQPRGERHASGECASLSADSEVNDEATLLSTRLDDEAGLLLLRRRSLDRGAEAPGEERVRLDDADEPRGPASPFPETGVAQALEETEAEVRVLPTLCPRGMPEHDPYWTQEAHIGEHHDLDRCDHTTCTKPFSNWQRVTALRELIKATDVLMRKQGVNYTLVSGSLLGQVRCGDIIPWDGDADVQVLDTDRDKLDALFEGPPNEDEAVPLDLGSPTSGPRGDRKVALDFIGYPTFALFSAFKCLPWRLVDTVTGFYVDIFAPAQFHLGWRTMSRRPIYSGRQPCDPRALYASWLETDFHWQHCETWKRCDDTPMYVIWPSKRCKFADFEVNCPADSAAYLDAIYPPSASYLKPDKPMRVAA